MKLRTEKKNGKELACYKLVKLTLIKWSTGCWMVSCVSATNHNFNKLK